MSGSYTYQHADLGTLEGIAGLLSSQGSFTGTIGHMDVQGQADVPGFHLSGNNHAVHLASNFHAEVNGTDGDTFIEHVTVQFRRTTLNATGSVAGQPEVRGKTIALQIAADRARVEDLLYLFTDEERPSMTGSISLHAKVEVPPGPPQFLRRMELTGRCGIDRSHFTNPHMQRPVDVLTESAEGEEKEQEEDDPQTVLSQLTGDVAAKDGIATLSNIAFTAPGTRAHLLGTYNLLNRKVDLHGVLYTDGELSDTTSGFKALLLMALSPFLKHKSVTVVPFTIGGIAPNATFALDLTGKHHQSSFPTH